jgi:hypothetical protein
LLVPEAVVVFVVVVVFTVMDNADGDADMVVMPDLEPPE